MALEGDIPFHSVEGKSKRQISKRRKIRKVNRRRRIDRKPEEKLREERKPNVALYKPQLIGGIVC
jgi:hypothetical protein